MDSVLKVKVKEAYGVNAVIVLCKDMDCLTTSNQIGTNEILFSQVTKNTHYYVELQFQNSLIEITDFFSCPHFNLEVTMLPKTEAIAT